MFLTLFMGVPVSLIILFLAFRQHNPRHDSLEPLSDEPIGELEMTLPNMVKGFAFTAYPVIDMQRARNFYEKDLGLKASKDYKGEWVEYHLWNNCFAITTMTDAKPSAEAGGRIALEVQNVDDFVKELQQKGIRIKINPFSTHVCRMAVVIDPEGNALTLHQRTKKVGVSE
jgi:predicted enzyme related to lactoylglutathione lyase